METMTLSSPITGATVTGYTIRYIYFNWGNATIDVGFADSAGKPDTKRYEGAIATSMMIALNKLDLSTKSLQRRVLERLVADGAIGAGTVTGTPD